MTTISEEAGNEFDEQQTSHFAAVQIIRPVSAPSTTYLKSSSSSFVNEASINQIKVAKLVLKPVQLKAKIAIKNNQQKPSIPPPQQQSKQVIQNEIVAADDQLMKKHDIELERVQKAPKEDKEKKTLNLQQKQATSSVQSPVINKSKMDETARCEARKFMKKQREKRKMEVKKEVDKSFIIKERLEELRRNTKNAIIKKPGQKKKNPLKITPVEDSNYYSLNNHKMKVIRELKLKPMPAQINIDNTLNVTSSQQEQQQQQPVDIQNPIKPSSPLHQQQNHENQLHLPSKRQSTQQQQLSARPSSSCKENKKPSYDDLKLKVPDLKLSMNHTAHTSSVLNRTDILHTQQSTAAAVPFWLQTTNIKPYPYNFIWAVRKKLEAFTQNEKKIKHQQTQFELDTPQLKRDKRLNKGRKLPQNVISDDESETNAKSEANTISEISSIKSDMVMMKSLSQERPQIKESVDDTSISESVFKSFSDDPFASKSDERVKPIKDKGENFLSSTKQPQESQEVIFKKPQIPLTVESSSGTKMDHHNDLDNNNKLNEDKEEEFKKMLLAFNKSLSHVVEVNHLLSTALVSKTSSSTSTQKTHESVTKKESTHEYSSSFEKNVESSDHQTSSIRTLIEDSKQQSGSNTIEEPPIKYHENAQELSSSTTKVTTTTTRTEVIHQKLSNDAIKEEHENTFNESRLINMFRLSESEISLIENATSVCNNSNNHFNKSTSDIKSWEKSLIERTRGQIAWLELQKLNFKKHGNLEKVSAVKKQQRAILLRLERERLQLKEKSEKSSTKPHENLVELAVSKMDISATIDFTGNDSDARDNIERILQQREQKINQRRSKIEHLMNWQRRLENEEKKLKLMEQDLLNANKFKLTKSPKKKSNDILNTSFEMVKSIDKSLKMLENVEISHDNETVEVNGNKMNKLWYRLTGIVNEKFMPKEIYHLTKRELAQFYENAKEAVLESDLKIFLEQSQHQQQALIAQKPESTSESENESKKVDNLHRQKQDKEENKLLSSPNDTMDSIANIETEEEEEYAGSYENEEITPSVNDDDDDDEDELNAIMANQMKVFVDEKKLDEIEIAPAITHFNNMTFQVQRKSQGEIYERETNHNNNVDDDVESASSTTTIAIEEMEIEQQQQQEEEESLINTEPIESIDLSAVDEDGSIIPEIQITDMDDNDEDNGQMIEDISFPNLEISLNDTEQIDYEEERAHDLSTITECTEYEQQSDFTSYTSTTPTTSERINSVEQRLLSINDSLEHVEEAFKNVPLQNTQSSVTYSTDQDFIDSNKMQSENEEEESNNQHL